jgi:hypothetical protein
MRGKADNPVSRARSRSAKKAQGTKRALLCKLSRDKDSRKLILSVMLDQGRQKGSETKSIVMQTKS